LSCGDVLVSYDIDLLYLYVAIKGMLYVIVGCLKKAGISGGLSLHISLSRDGII